MAKQLRWCRALRPLRGQRRPPASQPSSITGASDQLRLPNFQLGYLALSRFSSRLMHASSVFARRSLRYLAPCFSLTNASISRCGNRSQGLPCRDCCWQWSWPARIARTISSHVSPNSSCAVLWLRVAPLRRHSESRSAIACLALRLTLPWEGRGLPAIRLAYLGMRAALGNVGKAGEIDRV